MDIFEGQAIKERKNKFIKNLKHLHFKGHIEKVQMQPIEMVKKIFGNYISYKALISGYIKKLLFRSKKTNNLIC